VGDENLKGEKPSLCTDVAHHDEPLVLYLSREAAAQDLAGSPTARKESIGEEKALVA
jgi:hypothetical protein